MRDEVGMREAEVARRLGVSAAALRVWRQQGRGPVFCRFGKCVRYMPDDVADYIQASASGPGCVLVTSAGEPADD